MTLTALRSETQGASSEPPCTRAELKYAQVLEGARAVFLASGFEGASVDEIARTAGISKATLYRHFPDKTALFDAVLVAECARQAALHPELDQAGRPLPEFLRDLAKESMEFSLSEFGQSIYRIAVAESERFPHLGENFYRTGSARNRNRLAPALAAATGRGELDAVDAGYAAHVFFAICKADIFHRKLFSVGPVPDAAEIEAHAARSVETFLRAFGYRSAATAASR